MPNLPKNIPKLSLKLREKFSKENRDDAKLERIAGRRLGASPTGYKPRGGSFAGPTLQVDTGDSSISKKRSSSSLASVTMKALGDSFRKEEVEMSSFRSDYKEMLKLLDNLDYPGWNKLAAHLEEPQVKDRLIETTRSIYPEDVRNLSHDLIFRFVMVGFLEFLPANTENRSSATSSNEETEFVRAHVEFMASKHPAVLLAVTILSEHPSDLKRFEDHVQDEWGHTKLPEVMRESTRAIQNYTSRFGGIPTSIHKHIRYLLNVLVSLDDDHQYTNISIITGYLPWVYFQLDPEVNEREWIRHRLHVDETFWKLLDELYSDPCARWKAVQNIGKYYQNNPESNTVLHLMIYLWTMKKFNIHTRFPPEGVVSSDLLYDCATSLLKDFAPGSWQMQTYYVCTEGDTLVWALSKLPEENMNVLLVRLIIKNLGDWIPVRESSALQLGMIRTLYMSLKSCGVKEFLNEANSEDFRALGWHLGSYFKTHPVECVRKRHGKSHEKNGKPAPDVMQKPLDVDDDTAKTQIKEVLGTDRGYDIIPEDIPHEFDVPEEHWKLKIKFSVAILKKILVEGTETAATELLQALSAVNVAGTLRHTSIEKRASGSDDTLMYLVRRLQETETKQSVLEEVNFSKLEEALASEVALGLNSDSRTIV